jgi:hypothetical protein
MRILDATGDQMTSCLILMERRDTPLRFLLFPMTHLAAPSFYDGVRHRLSRCDLIVAEGIAGRSLEVSARTLSYRLTGRLRRSVCVQDYRTLLPSGVPAMNVDLTAREIVAELRKLPRRVRWAYLVLAPLAGVILAVLGPRVLFGKFGKYLTVDLSANLRPEQLRADIEIDSKLRTGADPGDLLTARGRRDARVLEVLTAIHERGQGEPRTVAVVYGAAHIPVIAKSLMIRHGYRARQAEWLVVFDHRA